jgi:hypothetical protein
MARTAETVDLVEKFKVQGAKLGVRPAGTWQDLGAGQGQGETAQNIMLKAGCAALSRPTGYGLYVF